MLLTYRVDEQPVCVEVPIATRFNAGAAVCLAQEFGDLSAQTDWYADGFKVLNSEDFFDYRKMRLAIHEALCTILQEEAPQLDLTSFTLENYHHFADWHVHQRTFARTRRLFPKDLSLDAEKIVNQLSDYFGVKLGYTNKITDTNQWIITRINRPGSFDCNPAHKDIYEVYDTASAIPRMINVWIPVCGVSHSVGLPVAPGSHLISEDQISRTRAGCEVNGQTYSVNCIKDWGGATDLTTQCPQPDEMLLFSSHLVHGLARNTHPDTTRMSLEFRLYEQ